MKLREQLVFDDGLYTRRHLLLDLMAVDLRKLSEDEANSLCRRVAEVKFAVFLATFFPSVFKLCAANTGEVAAGVLVDDLVLLGAELPALLGVGHGYRAPLLDHGPDDVEVDFAIESIERDMWISAEADAGLGSLASNGYPRANRVLVGLGDFLERACRGVEEMHCLQGLQVEAHLGVC